jgi:mannan endo-1,4-beta-mannosidase
MIMKTKALIPLMVVFLVLALVVPRAQAAAKKKKGKVSLAAAVATSARGLQVDGLSLKADGKPVYLTGLEAPGLYRMSPDQLTAFFTQAKAAGVWVVKTNGFSLGKAPMPLQTGPGTWDEQALAKLDQMTAAAGKAGLKLVLDLCADSGPEGGKGYYATWAGSHNPGVFYLDFQCKAWYQQYVKMLLDRVNKVTGISYAKDPNIWAFNLIDAPRYELGDPSIADQWATSMAIFVKSLGTEAKVVLSMDPGAPGLSAVELADQPGVDFILEEMTTNAPNPGTWAQQIGKPVVPIAANSQAAEAYSGAGYMVSIDPTQTVHWTDLQTSLTAISKSAVLVGSGLFTGVSASPQGEPVVDWGATEAVSVVLSTSAQVSVRYGENGLLNHETGLSQPALSQQILLRNLSTGKHYDFQVKAASGSGYQYSNILSFEVPPLKRLIAPSQPWSKNFITVKGTSFYDGDKPFRFVGTNNYYLHYMPDSVEYIFSEAEKMGFTVMRTWAFGESSKPVPDDWEKLRYFQTAPGQYVESNLQLLDHVIASAGKHHIRLVLALSGNWNDFGGAPQWAKWYGSSVKNDFFDNPAIEKGFQDWMAMLVNRVNTVTGVAYKNDPTIMAWDLMNEPRDEKDTSGNFLAVWIDQMAGFLKKTGVQQLVTTGEEGLRANNGTHYSGTDFIRDHQSPSIDYAVFHVYPTQNGAGWNAKTLAAILTAYVRDAHEILKKPVVMEEFGIEKGKPGYDQAQWIYEMMRVFYAAGGDGTNYWMLGAPHDSSDANSFNPDDVNIANLFVLQAEKLEGGR